MATKQLKYYIRTLFNKNHIKIESQEYINPPSTLISSEYVEFHTIHNTREENIEVRLPKIYKIGRKEYVKEISKLGFWYYRPCTQYQLQNENRAKAIKYTDILHEIKIVTKKITYTITYLKQYGHNVVSPDQRPWDISPEGSMADHYVEALLKIMNDIFDFAATNKLQLRTKKINYGPNNYEQMYEFSDLNDFKRKIYTELFGSATGPIYQTNNEKILSHGFDTKISFRRRKE